MRAQFIEPMLPTLAEETPEGEDWIHEVKHGGYRSCRWSLCHHPVLGSRPGRREGLLRGCGQHGAGRHRLMLARATYVQRTRARGFRPICTCCRSLKSPPS